MTDDIYVYPADLPIGTHEMVSPCADGYTVYVNTRYTREAQLGAYLHAVKHVEGRDWEKDNVQDIEVRAHNREE